MIIRRIGPKSVVVANTLTLVMTGSVPADTIKDVGNTTEIHVIGRDVNGDPVEPGAGTFTVTAQTAKDGNFYAITDGGTLDATKCGGSATAAGTGEFASFRGVPIQIKVVPAGITTAISYSVEAVQIGS